MKILVIGLDGAASELLFGDERLTNFRRLMEWGCYGRLESVIPPVRVPAWMCMATSQDPGSLGVYGLRNRRGHAYTDLEMVNSKLIQEITIWDQVERQGKRAIIIGVRPWNDERGMMNDEFSCSSFIIHPSSFRKDWLRDEIYTMSRKHFEVVRHFLQNAEWDYFQFVEVGLDRLQHGFWQFHDPQHGLYEPGNPYEDVIRDYYLYLDDELGKIFEVLSDDTAILVISPYSLQRLDGSFCVNEWLVNEGLLVLNEYPKEITPLDKLNVNWEKTKVWSQGRYCARVFFNVKGREPNGTIDQADYEKFCDDIIARLKAAVDDKGRPVSTRVFKPEEIYKTVRNVAPDLLVHFGDYWRSIGSVGHHTIHYPKSDTTDTTDLHRLHSFKESVIICEIGGHDGCNHAPFGSFILAASNNPLHGEIEGAHLLDMAPTLLGLGGYDRPTSMQGTSLVAGQTLDTEADTGLSLDEEEIIRQRLSGLGYIS